jgi:hypothetical protein
LKKYENKTEKKDVQTNINSKKTVIAATETTGKGKRRSKEK